MSARKLTAADCRACGACCVACGNGDDVVRYGYADMTSEDVARVSPRVRDKLLAIYIGGETRHATKAKQLLSGKHACLHLRGTPGQRCSCSIYDTKPDVCSDFRVGSAMCRMARKALAETS